MSTEIVRLAEEERRESVDLYQFTRLVTEKFSREERLRLVEVIWGVVYSDGALTSAENQLARRIAELLGFQHPEVQAVREKVKGESLSPARCSARPRRAATRFSGGMRSSGAGISAST